jgi:hypothetical protein
VDQVEHEGRPRQGTDDRSGEKVGLAHGYLASQDDESPDHCCRARSKSSWVSISM